MASADSLTLHEQVGEAGLGAPKANNRALELVYDRGEKVIRFPDVDTLIDFLKRAA